jgi:hypothetical protein
MKRNATTNDFSIKDIANELKELTRIWEFELKNDVIMYSLQAVYSGHKLLILLIFKTSKSYEPLFLQVDCKGLRMKASRKRFTEKLYIMIYSQFYTTIS